MTHVNEVFLDWGFDEDAQHNYRFSLVHSAHLFEPGVHVRLRTVGRAETCYGTVLSVDGDGIVIHTDDGLDITESYSLGVLDK